MQISIKETKCFDPHLLLLLFPLDSHSDVTPFLVTTRKSKESGGLFGWVRRRQTLILGITELWRLTLASNGISVRRPIDDSTREPWIVFLRTMYHNGIRTGHGVRLDQKFLGSFAHVAL